MSSPFKEKLYCDRDPGLINQKNYLCDCCNQSFEVNAESEQLVEQEIEEHNLCQSSDDYDRETEATKVICYSCLALTTEDINRREDIGKI